MKKRRRRAPPEPEPARGPSPSHAHAGSPRALDDITVTQVATVAEIHERRPDLSVAELVTSGIRVGREHIASTVNTLLLAYAGASMPLKEPALEAGRVSASTCAT